MSDDFPACRHARPESYDWRKCTAPVPASVPACVGSMPIVHAGHCAACPVPQAEAALRERIVGRIESMMSAGGPQAYTRDRVIAIVREELPE